MRKIPTLFERNPSDRRHLLRIVADGCEWVLAGEGTPTRKFDGVCVRIDETGAAWARREVKDGKPDPDGFELAEHDTTTGKRVGWEPASQSGFARFIAEALERLVEPEPGTYELCGPKVNGNPEQLDSHQLIRHGQWRYPLPWLERDPADAFETLRTALLDEVHEGVVWHHPDGRMVKLKRRDFR